MREIKFRFYSKVEKNMIYASLDDFVKHFGFEYNLPIHMSELNAFDYPHYMQYTGQIDKNGADIYENDIVSMDGESCKGVVKWLDEDCMFVVVYHEKIGFYETPGYWFQVIGNIHDNPELLEEK